MKFLLLGVTLTAAAVLIAGIVAQQRPEAGDTARARPEIDVKAPTKLETATFALG